jgi:antitoxin ParD1/3/4
VTSPAVLLFLGCPAVSGSFEQLAKFCHPPILRRMATMNISLPDSLKSFVDEQVADRGYGTNSEYVRDLIRKEQDRERLRALVLEGAASAPGEPVDEAYFESLRDLARGRIAE